MLRLTTDKKIDIMDAKNAPSARCKSGDTVLFETLDCYDCSVTRQGERLKIDRMHNPATGPLFIEGAEVGKGLHRPDDDEDDEEENKPAETAETEKPENFWEHKSR